MRPVGFYLNCTVRGRLKTTASFAREQRPVEPVFIDPCKRFIASLSSFVNAYLFPKSLPLYYSKFSWKKQSSDENFPILLSL